MRKRTRPRSNADKRAAVSWCEVNELGVRFVLPYFIHLAKL
jgi:hypothetical protein